MDAIITYFKQGGIFMYPILAGSVWALTLITERFIFFRQAAHRVTEISAAFFKSLAADGFDAAGKELEGRSGVMVSLLNSARHNRHKSLSLVEKNMEEIILAEVPDLEKNLNTLSVLAGLMPILGLLGTVTGMIATFKVIAMHGTSDAQAMADGISEALVTTQAGLVSALPIILGHLFLSNRFKKILSKIQECSTKVLNHIEEHGA